MVVFDKVSNVIHQGHMGEIQSQSCPIGAHHTRAPRYHAGGITFGLSEGAGQPRSWVVGGGLMVWTSLSPQVMVDSVGGHPVAAEGGAGCATM